MLKVLFSTIMAMLMCLSAEMVLAMGSPAPDDTKPLDDEIRALFTEEELKLIREHGRLAICGESGEIVGTERHAGAAEMADCPETGWKAGSFRHRVIEAHNSMIFGDDAGPFLSEEELAKFRSKEDIELGIKCGEIIGSSRNLTMDEIEKCQEMGWNVDSLRHRLIRAQERFIMGDDSGPR